MMDTILFDIVHPAHIHQFRRFMEYYDDNKYKIIVTTRDKDVSIDLLEYYEIPFNKISKYQRSILSKGFNFFTTTFTLHEIIKKYSPSVIISKASPYVNFSSKLFNIPHLVFPDSECVTFNDYFVFPYASAIITPKWYIKDFRRKQRRLDGIFEEFYLTPNYYSPNLEVLSQYGISEKTRLFTIRFIDWKAHHDIGLSGLNSEQKISIVNKLAEYGEVVISSEKELPSELHKYQLRVHPAKIFDLIYYSDLFITDGQTMAQEAGLLGTPTVRINTMYFSINSYKVLHAMGLVYSYNNYNDAMDKINYFLMNPNLKRNWTLKREVYFKDKQDIFFSAIDIINEFL